MREQINSLEYWQEDYDRASCGQNVYSIQNCAVFQDEECSWNKILGSVTEHELPMAVTGHACHQR